MKIVEAGGVAVIIAAMKNHATHAGVQQYACLGLWIISLNETARRSVGSEARELALKALQNHKGDTNVKSYANGFLSTFNSFS